ncbi:MAG: class I SAM-dependent methyltransferase [Patescibacteria group bacterium]
MIMTHNTLHTRCALCNSDDASVICRTAALKSGEVRDVTNVICNRCGLIYNNPMPSGAALREYYQGEFAQDKIGRPGATETQYDKILASMSEGSSSKTDRIADWLSLFLTTRSRVLDVGCGTGTLLASIRWRSGCDVYGVEPDELMARAAREYHGIPSITTGFMEEYSPPVDMRFDLIILRHVLEHLRDPNAAIEKIKSWLVPNGYLYFAFPNAANFSRSRPLNRCLEFGHLHSFTPFTTAQILLRHGMKIVQWRDDPLFLLETVATSIDNPIEAVAIDELRESGGSVRELKRKMRLQPARHFLFRCRRKARSFLS